MGQRSFFVTCVCVAAAAGAGAGCGNQRGRAPDPQASAKPAKVRTYRYATAGVAFAAPRNWSQRAGRSPLVAVVSSGRATIAVWRYRRSEPLPGDRTALQDARASLVDAARARDRTLKIESARAFTRHGTRGIELVGRETIDGQPRRVRSVHLFDRGVEVVVDAYAPPALFGRIDRAVFQPLIASVELSAPTPAHP